MLRMIHAAPLADAPLLESRCLCMLVWVHAWRPLWGVHADSQACALMAVSRAC